MKANMSRQPAPAAVTMVAVVVLPAHFDVHFILVLLLATQIFHQWRIHPSAYKRVAVVSHRGQEYFKVCPMGFRNGGTYVQRPILIVDDI
jgi:hypothetical protein